MAKLFKTAFAYQGTKEQLPADAQVDGKASFAEGFTAAYTLDYGDADARDIAQSELNGILHDVTEAIGELQKYGAAAWQADMSPIAKSSIVFHDGKLWQAKTNTSTQPAQGANWQQVDIADIVSQIGALDLTDYATKTYVDNSVNGLASISYVDAGLASKATASVVNAQLAGKFDKTDVVQESGQSTTKVMSQKAVTDAISDAASGQLSWGAITGDIENQEDLQNALKSMRWGIITGNVTLTDEDNGKTFLITNDAVITIDDELSAGWNVAFIPDDSKDSTAYNITLSFVGLGSTIGSLDTIKGACSLALTPISNLFAAAGTIE